MEPLWFQACCSLEEASDGEMQFVDATDTRG